MICWNWDYSFVSITKGYICHNGSNIYYDIKQVKDWVAQKESNPSSYLIDVSPGSVEKLRLSQCVDRADHEQISQGLRCLNALF